jgi:hypothetical protein
MSHIGRCWPLCLASAHGVVPLTQKTPRTLAQYTNLKPFGVFFISKTSVMYRIIMTHQNFILESHPAPSTLATM